MRFYGVRSGRNNVPRMITRSIMYNTPNNNAIINNNTNTHNDEDSFYSEFSALAFSALICGGIYALLFH